MMEIGVRGREKDCGMEGRKGWMKACKKIKREMVRVFVKTANSLRSGVNGRIW